LGLEGTITIAWRTQLQRSIASDNGLLGIAVAGIGRRFRLIFIVAEVMGNFGIERRLDANFLQQAIELVKVFRGFEILASSLARVCNCFSFITVTCF